MSRQTTSRVALLMLALAIFPGCSPTQPFYFHSDGDLSHYLDKATELEYPDVCAEPLPDTSLSEKPLSVTNPDFKEMWDLPLEECVTIALQNSKVIRNLGGVTPITFADGLVERTSGASTVFDPAIQASSAGSGRPTLDQAGGVEAALADFDAQFSMRGGSPSGTLMSRKDRVENRGGAAATVFADQNDTYAGGLRTDLAKRTATGARFTMSNFTDYDRWNGPTDVFPVGPGRKVASVWSTAFEVRWDQPLLRGRGTMVNRVPVMLARISEDISLSQFESSVRNMVKDIEDTYWDLHGWYRNLETAKTARDSAQGAWRIVYEKFNEGVAPAQEEAYAREQYFQFRAGVETSLQNLYNTETRLRWLMGLAATDGRLIRPIDEPTMARVDFEWAAIRTEALVRSPELRQKKWILKGRELELVAAKNQLLPQLDVGALYRWIGVGDELIRDGNDGRDFSSDDDAKYFGSSAFGELASGNYQEADIFFTFAFPVGFRREMAGVRNVQLKLAREKAQLEDMELNTIHLLSTAVRNVESFYVQAQTHFNRWSAAEKEVESATAKWKGGADTVDKVLDAQQRRAQAQLSFYQSLVEYNKAIADVHFRKGSLLEYNNIELTEGNWPQKAYWDALGLARQRDASYYLNYGWTRPDVVSAGPVDQGMGMPVMGQPTPAEVIPTPEPTPAEPAPAEGQPAIESVPAPKAAPASEAAPATEAAPAPPSVLAPELGPMTGGPSGPMLNAPVVSSPNARPASVAADNPLRSRSFELGTLGLNQLRPGAASAPQGATNALRPSAPENASPVQPASYSATIGDSPNSGK
ncbi:MAG TPA: TolC family protein [Candidatus Anammoximicrobium sp.]|nr:TolC family protein [Candidatus Anammoximicrobium sp.]